MSPERTIVVVDDDASMSQATERLLTVAGWKPLMFVSAEALLESDGVGMASGFILDIHLPGLSGFALHEKLQKAGIMAPVTFITAHDLEWAKKQAQSVGAIGYFVKPFDGRSLIETLDRNCSPV